MLGMNYRPNGRGWIGRPLKRILDEAETFLSSRNSWRMMTMMIMISLYLQTVWLYVRKNHCISIRYYF